MVSIVKGWGRMPLSPTAFGTVLQSLAPDAVPTMACIAVTRECVAGRIIPPSMFGNNVPDPKKARYIKLENLRSVFASGAAPEVFEFHVLLGAPANLCVFVISHDASFSYAEGACRTVHLAGEAKSANVTMKNGMRPSIPLWKKMFGDAFGAPAAVIADPSALPPTAKRAHACTYQQQDPICRIDYLAEPPPPTNAVRRPPYKNVSLWQPLGPLKYQRKSPEAELQLLMAAATGSTRLALQGIEQLVDRIAGGGERWRSPHDLTDPAYDSLLETEQGIVVPWPEGSRLL